MSSRCLLLNHHLLPVWLLFISFAGCLPFSCLASPFNGAREFPNYFLPEAYREVSQDRIPPQVLDERQALIEKALSSVFHRVNLPVVSEGTVRQVRIFPYLDGKMENGEHLLASGGVVRSALAYIYRQVALQIRMSSQESPDLILQRIIHDTSDLKVGQTLGVGSDFDLLILDSTSGRSTASAEAQVSRIINSAANHFGVTSLGESGTRVLFPVGDVHAYHDQTTRAMGNGGSSLDWIAFDFNTGHMVLPARDPQVFKRFLAGALEFLPVGPGLTRRDPEATVVRGFRALYEIPFLRLTSDAERVLKEEVERFSGPGQADSPGMGKAYKQMDKLIRNAFSGGANNRMLRTPPGGAEWSFLSFFKAVSKMGKIRLPDYIGYFVREKAGVLGSKVLSPDLLISPDRFKREFTRDGKLFHGTGSLENAISILRGNLLASAPLSSGDHGRAAYTTGKYELARHYAIANHGFVITLGLKDPANINVLDLKQFEQSPTSALIQRQADSAAVPLFEYLASRYGIDFIVNSLGEVLVENADAVVFSELSDLIKDEIAVDYDDPTVSTSAKVGAYLRSRRLFPYLIALGETPTRLEDQHQAIQSALISQANAGTLNLQEIHAQNFGSSNSGSMLDILYDPILGDIRADFRPVLLRDLRLTPVPQYLYSDVLPALYSSPYQNGIWVASLRKRIVLQPNSDPYRFKWAAIAIEGATDFDQLRDQILHLPDFAAIVDKTFLDYRSHIPDARVLSVSVKLVQLGRLDERLLSFMDAAPRGPLGPTKGGIELVRELAKRPENGEALFRLANNSSWSDNPVIAKLRQELVATRPLPEILLWTRRVSINFDDPLIIQLFDRAIRSRDAQNIRAVGTWLQRTAKDKIGAPQSLKRLEEVIKSGVAQDIVHDVFWSSMYGDVLRNSPWLNCPEIKALFPAGRVPTDVEVQLKERFTQGLSFGETGMTTNHDNIPGCLEAHLN